MEWIILFIAGLFETFWAICMKLSHGFTRPVPTFFTVAGMIMSFFLLAMALKHLPISTAYAVWTGIGIIGTFLAGIFFLHESISLPQIISLLLIAAGITGVRIFS